jgi:acyl-CoA thioesterase-2
VNAALESLIEVLGLEPIEVNIFRGHNESESRARLFGGQVAAQAFTAAARTVDGLTAHSLHGYFLRAGDPSIPIIFNVDRIRDGRSFATRRVVAVQHGEAIFNMSVSYHIVEDGYEHQDPIPDAPAPESLPTWEERMAEIADKMPAQATNWLSAERPIEYRSLEPHGMFASEPATGPNPVWIRANGKLPDDPLIHQCLFVYASDMGMVSNIHRPHRKSGRFFFRDVMMASLDHAVWFHRTFRMDEWLLFTQHSPIASGARGFANATLYTRDGTRVATVAQEGLMRRIDPEKLGGESAQ